MNFEQPPAENTSEKKEYVVSAAIRYKGEVFIGQMHPDAAVQIWEKYPEIKNDTPDFEEGFTTSIGRFVSREEAGDIAHKSKQLDHIDDLAEKAYASMQLDSEDIQNENK